MSMVVSLRSPVMDPSAMLFAVSAMKVKNEESEMVRRDVLVVGIGLNLKMDQRLWCKTSNFLTTSRKQGDTSNIGQAEGTLTHQKIERHEKRRGTGRTEKGGRPEWTGQERVIGVVSTIQIYYLHA